MRRFAPVAALVLGLMTAFSIGCRAQAPGAAVPAKEQFRQLVMAERKPLQANPKLVSQMETGTLKIERVRFAIEEGQEAVALVYRPKAEAKYPTVVVQHYLGGSKDDILLGFAMAGMANKGYLVAAIDGRFRGERQNGKALPVAMLEALRSGKGHPFLVDTVYDVQKFLDYLQTRPDVDAERIGMTGISEGGIITWMTAAIDPRIKVAVPIIGVTAFSQAFEELEGPDTPARLQLFGEVLKAYAQDLGEKEPNAKVLRAALQKLVPGIVDRFDGPSLLPEIAPRPLLIISNEKDELFPIDGARKAHAAAEARYKELKAEERLKFTVNLGKKHADASVLGTATAALGEWMDRWLKAPAN